MLATLPFRLLAVPLLCLPLALWLSIIGGADVAAQVQTTSTYT
jgi:hypothetical protein